MYSPPPELVASLTAAVFKRKGKRNGHEVAFCCPAHEDAEPSASWNEEKGTWTCFACQASGGAKDLAKRLGVDTPKAPRPKIVATYDYLDRGGKMLFQAVRREPGAGGKSKDFRQRRPDEAGGWHWNLKGVRTVLYRLPDVVKAAGAGKLVIIVEGEKDADGAAGLRLVATCNPMGAGKWRDHYAKQLQGAKVAIIPDNDTAGRKHAAAAAKSLGGAGVEWKILELERLPEKGDLSNWIAARRAENLSVLEIRAQLLELIKQAPMRVLPEWDLEKEEGPQGDGDDPRPVIRIGPELSEMADKAEKALGAFQGAEVFHRGGGLVRVVRIRRQGAVIGRAVDAPVIDPLPVDTARELLGRVARCTRFDKRSDDWKSVPPPLDLVRILLSRKAFPHLRLLSGLTETPALRSDGSLIDQPGYDKKTGIFFDPHGERFPAVPSRPTRTEAEKALAQLEEVFEDFPFQEPHYRSAAVAALLTCVSRSAIEGPAPLFGISATSPGSGKSLLADVCALVSTGRVAPRLIPNRNEEEERKRLFAIALSGDLLVCIDNVEHALGSAALAAALTSEAIKDRVLGESRDAEVPFRTVVLATGNGLIFRGDLGRRVVPIAIDPACEDPEERKGFRHPDLKAWVRKERPRLVVAALTALRGFVVAGRPLQPFPAFGSFEAWSELIRSSLVWLGRPDPCAGRERIRKEAQPEVIALGAALVSWREAFGDEPMTIRDVLEELKATEVEKLKELRDQLGELIPRGELNARRLGYVFRHRKGRIIRKHRLESPGQDRKGTTVWQVIKTETSQSAGDAGDAGDPPTPRKEVAGKESINDSYIEVAERSPASPSSPATGPEEAQGLMEMPDDWLDDEGMLT